MDWREWLSLIAHLSAGLLCIYALLVIVVFGAVCFGLAWGLRWGHGKLDWVLAKVDDLAALVDRYSRQGMDVAATPSVRGAAAVAGLTAFVRHLVRPRRPFV